MPGVTKAMRGTDGLVLTGYHGADLPVRGGHLPAH